MLFILKMLRMIKFIDVKMFIYSVIKNYVLRVYFLIVDIYV